MTKDTTTAGPAVSSPLDITAAVPNGKTLSIDVSQSTQLAAAFNVVSEPSGRARTSSA